MAQGFNFVYNDYGKDETRLTDKLFTNAEGAFAGQAVKLVSGRWTKASGTDAIGGFLTANVVAGTDKECEVIMAREGDWFEVPYTGTPAAGFVAGANAVTVAADGLSLNSATVAGGAVAVYSINTNKKTARVKIKQRQFS
ncbi:hypothetical protein WMW72_10640 [Paenibacillus filicis]|uniref:Uncharacterized protein n=1 Tax=Paenibacillus filicis TaxID=669464 RepID=A0ABU9DHM6_9BACL